MIKFSTFTFGCRVNQAEIEAISSDLIKAGWSYSVNRPDIIIINTCAVTTKAEREARQLIYQQDKKLPKAQNVVTGCSATYWKKNKLYQNLPIDLIVENVSKSSLPNTLLHLRSVVRSKAKIQNTNSHSKFLSSGRFVLKIQDGCNRFCSYCIVPYLRGRSKSIPISKIVSKINSLDKSIKEVILTAINTEYFGLEHQESLPKLISNIIEKTKISRLSFGSINPWSLNKEFFDLYKTIANSERFVHFFHIPLQSGSNRILKLMKREYSIKEYLSKISKIKKINSQAFIATDVIVGFPGETDDDFKTTYEFLKKARIDKFHVFRYSKRLNTAAYYMSRQYKEPIDEVKKQRSKILRELSSEKYAKFCGRERT